MIVIETIFSLKEPKGSSLDSIFQFIKSNYPEFTLKTLNKIIKDLIKKNNIIVKNGLFKISSDIAKYFKEFQKEEDQSSEEIRKAARIAAIEIMEKIFKNANKNLSSRKTKCKKRSLKKELRKKS